MISTGPSTTCHSPKNPSFITQRLARGSRRMLSVFIAVSRVLTTTRPSASTVAATGDS